MKFGLHQPIGYLVLGLIFTLLGCDSSGGSQGTTNTEEITANFSSSTTYYILAEGYAGATGAYNLKVELAAVDFDAIIQPNPTSGIPGGTVSLAVTLQNIGGMTASNVTATLSTTDAEVIIQDGTAAFGSILAGGNAVNTTDPLVFRIASSHVNNQPVSLSMTVTASGGGSWVFPVSVPVPFADLDLVNLSLSDPGGNNNGFPDPGESVSLGFGVTNSGASTATGPISVAVSIEAGSTVSGATLLPTGSTVCSAGNLAVGGTAACPARTLTIPAGAANGQTIILNFAFTDAAAHTWSERRTLVVGGAVFASILPVLDPIGDNGAYNCDLRDVQASVDATNILRIRTIFATPCNLTGIHDVYMYDGTRMITLTLEGNAKNIWTNASGTWELTPNPTSFTITPLSGTTLDVTYTIPLADIPNLVITGNSVMMFAAVILSWSEADYNDYAPDSPGGSMPWVTFAW